MTTPKEGLPCASDQPQPQLTSGTEKEPAAGLRLEPALQHLRLHGIIGFDPPVRTLETIQPKLDTLWLFDIAMENCP